MSETLCTLRTKGGGGGKYTETSLWTNQSPSSSFAGQTVTLSDSVSNYKYIAIKSGFNSSYYSDSESMTIVVPVDELKKATDNTSVRHSALSLCGRYNNSYTRTFFYTSDTTIAFSSCYQYATTTQTNGNCIPLEILGLNELDHGKRFDETVLWTNTSPSSDQASASKTLDTGKFSDYDFIKLVWNYATNVSTSYSTYISYADFIQFQTGTGNGQGAIFIGTTSASNVHYGRPIYYTNDTSFQIGNCYQAASSTIANSRTILVNIIGCKFK